MRALALPLALAVAFAGCIATPAPEPVQDQQVPLAEPVALEALAFTDQEATLLALPVLGGQTEFTYDVPEGARWVAATLTWATRGTTLTLTATDPAGEEQGESRTLAGGGPRSPTRLDWWAPEPAAGTWTFLVQGEAALQEPVRIQFHTAREVQGMHVAQQTSVGPTGFVEVNLEMKAGDVFTFDWATDAPVHFDIHTHRNGETQYLVDETVDAMRGTFTADEDGGYSLLWAQEGDAGPVPAPGGPSIPLEYRIDGAFALHSAIG